MRSRDKGRFRRATAVGIAMAWLTASAATFAEAGDAPIRVTAAEVASRLDALAKEHPDHVTTSRIGMSREGTAIPVVRLGAMADGGTSSGPDDRPALLVVAGVDGRHAVGSATALGLVESLARDHADMFATRTVYVIPLVNPDGAKRGISGVMVAEDDDRDGRTDEDGPADLDGDGKITWMRLTDPPIGVTRTHHADENDPRLMIESDASKGERATHALLVEGRDRDGDGRVGEDGAGETSLDRNFPHHWPEVGAGIGKYPLSEPESRALVDWMLARDNIACVVVFGPHDNLVEAPTSGKFDETKRAPVGLEKDDAPYHEAIREIFTEITGMKKGAAPAADDAGSFHRWAYAQYGVPTFATVVWGRPDAVTTREKPESESDAADSDSAKPAARGGSRGGGKDADPLAEDRAWLAYSDAERRGDLFVDWKPFDHPQYGEVEIGGFVPGYRFDVPKSELPRLVDEQTRFAAALLERFPNVRIHEPWVEKLGDGVFRVRLVVSNDGFLPTTSAIGVKTRRLTPNVFRLQLPEERVLAGDLVSRQWSIGGSGGTAEADWIVTGSEGDSIRVELMSSLVGTRTIEIPLRATSGKEGDR